MGSIAQGRMNRGLLGFLVMTVLLGAAEAEGWSTSSHHRMVRDAVGFLPPVLRGMLRLYAKELQAGVGEAARYSAELLGNQQPVAEGLAAEALEREMRELTLHIRGHRPFGQIFLRFGRLVGPVAELNAPLRLARGEDPFLPELRVGFDTLSDAAAPKFRILWGGYRDELMRGLPPAQYFLESSGRARDLYPVLYGALVAGGQVVPVSSFDYTSIPFGVASMSYSRSVNSIVNVWCAIWREAGGDMSGRPF